jgi:hypothetical protein
VAVALSATLLLLTQFLVCCLHRLNPSGEADGQLRRAYDRAGSFFDACANQAVHGQAVIGIVAVTRTRINARILSLADIRGGFRLLFSYPVVRSCTERMNQRNVDVLRTSMSFVLDPATLRVPTRTTTG